MKNQIARIFVVLLVLTSCSVWKYGKNVREDTIRIFSEKKQFFKELAFVGNIKAKKNKPDDKIAPYRLLIEIETISDTLTISNIQNTPYYSFDSYTPKELELSITEEIFNAVSSGERIMKKVQSDSIQIERVNYLLLSSDKENWN